MSTQLAIDKINAEAREIRFWRTALTAAAAVLFALGWCLAKVFAVLWLAVVWCYAAVKAGWLTALTLKEPAPLPPEAAVLRENEDLREQVQALTNILQSRSAGLK